MMLMVLAAWGCRAVRYVPVESRDSVRVEVRERTVRLRDTVWMEKYKYLYRDKVVRDTVSVVKRDTVRVPYPVEKELTRWERFRLDVGGYAIFTVITVVLIVVGWLIYKLKKGGGIMK